MTPDELEQLWQAWCAQPSNFHLANRLENAIADLAREKGLSSTEYRIKFNEFKRNLLNPIIKIERAKVKPTISYDKPQPRRVAPNTFCSYPECGLTATTGSDKCWTHLTHLKVPS